MYEGEKVSRLKLQSICFLIYYLKTTLQELISCDHQGLMVPDFHAASQDSFGIFTLVQTQERSRNSEQSRTTLAASSLQGYQQQHGYPRL